MFLQAKYVEQIAPSQQFARFVLQKLKSLGAPDDCWVFGNDIDGRQMKLEAALDEVIGWRGGTIVSCLPGKLAFFESEDGRVRFDNSIAARIRRRTPALRQLAAEQLWPPAESEAHP